MCFFRRKKKEKQVVEKKVVEQPKEVVKEKEEEPKESVVKNTYHVSQNKDPKNDNYKKWRVRKEGSNKTIKYFDTQKEAIDYANELAANNEGNVVIHKLDGKIRKQDYSK